MTDHEIIELFFARDEGAIRETDKKYGAYCMSIAENILKSTPDAEECVNDTYLKTWNTIPPERPHSLKVFLACIVRRLSINRYNSWHTAKRDRNLEVAFEELSETIPMRDEEAGELTRLLNEFLERLDATERRIMVRRYWYAMTPAQIAKAEEMTTNAVNVRLYKTRNKLRSFLNKRGYSV